jgi:Transglutaminase-like superfamily
MPRRPDLPTLRAAAWAARALWQARRTLRRGGVAGARVGAPPPLPRSAGRGVHAVLRRSPATCLERALVLQRWEAAHGAPAAVVIGVQGPARGFRAHAWLEGRPDRLAGAYDELARLPAERS